MRFILFFLSAILLSFDTVFAAKSTPQPVINPVTYNRPVEQHHSLNLPFDKTNVYWTIGGSTVLTRTKIRLTPSQQDRRGWIWNEYPIESNNFEIELKLEINSKPHYGGDGLGIWVISSDHDPSYSNDPEAMTGPIFGMKADFTGFGVLIDTYDNDNKRNNPSVFVLQNFPEDDTSSSSSSSQDKKTPKPQKPLKFNHDNDFENDMVKTRPLMSAALPSTHLDSSKTYQSYKCIGDVRNTGRPSKMLLKLIDGSLYVYLDTHEGIGYKFCLAVQLERSDFHDYHLVLTAATGQVADNMDILEITTRYLKGDEDTSADAKIGELSHSFNRNAPHRTLQSLFWFGCFGLAGALLAAVVFDFYTYNKLKQAQIETTAIVTRLNQLLLLQYVGQWVLTVMMLISFSWLGFFFCLPLAAHRGYLFSKKMHLFNPSHIGGVKGHGTTAVVNRHITERLLLPALLLVMVFIYCFVQWLRI